jgi:hypothetical protein
VRSIGCGKTHFFYTAFRVCLRTTLSKLSPVEPALSLSKGTAESYPGRSPMSANLFRVFSSKRPQNRHPERSASQIYRVIRRLVARSRRTPTVLSYPCYSELFNHRARTGRARQGLSLEPRAKNLLASCYVRRLRLHSRQPYRHALHWRHQQPVSPCHANIRRARGKVSLRPMAASARSTLKATKIFAQPLLGKKQLKGWRRAKKLNLIRTIHPEFKDLAQTWGRKMITVHEKMYP